MIFKMFKNLSKSVFYLVCTVMIIGMVFGVTNLSVIKAAAEPSVVGYIDGATIQNSYPALMTAIENINNEKTRLEAELNSKAEGQDATTIAKLQEQYNETFNNYAQKQLEPVSTKMNNAVEAAAKEKGVTIVVDYSVVHYGGIDLTQAVATKMGIKLQ